MVSIIAVVIIIIILCMIKPKKQHKNKIKLFKSCQNYVEADKYNEILIMTQTPDNVHHLKYKSMDIPNNTRYVIYVKKNINNRLQTISNFKPQVINKSVNIPILRMIGEAGHLINNSQCELYYYIKFLDDYYQPDNKPENIKQRIKHKNKYDLLTKNGSIKNCQTILF